MNTMLRRIRNDERGMALVFVGLGFLGLLAASMLAIDVGMLATSRAQAQNSADAGALAGAVALVFNDFTDRTPSGPAVQSALQAARRNAVMNGTVSVEPDDVTFPNGPTGQPDRVRVQVFRTAQRGNSMSLLMAQIFGFQTGETQAEATAEAVPANAATCIKPWAIPDKWIEIQEPPWDEGDTFDIYERVGQQVGGRPLSNPDQYVRATQTGYTGYQSNPTGPDYGRRILLKAGNPNQAISASHFYPIDLPPGGGASWYEENIPGCWPGVMKIGDRVIVQTGAMQGPTVSGTQALIDKDPNAWWDPRNRRVVSDYSPSPRIIVMPVFNPVEYEESRRHGQQMIEVANLVAFFVDDLQGNDVLGYMIPAAGLLRDDSIVGGAFLRAIRLVQ